MIKLQDGWVYTLADQSMVEAKEIEPGKWHLWSLDDNREYKIKKNGDIVMLPFIAGHVDDLTDTGMRYDRENNLVVSRPK